MIEQISKQINESRKAKDTFRTKVLSSIKTELLYNSKSNKPVEDIATIKSYKKKLVKGLQAYPEGEQRSLLEKEIEIISEFLPKEASEETIRTVTKSVLEKTDEMNKGKLIGLILKTLNGEVDGSLVAKIVSQEIANVKV